MTKMLDGLLPHPPGPCSGWCPDAVAHALTDVPDSTGFRKGISDTTNDAASNCSDPLLIKKNEAGFLKASGRFREQVDVEIGQASAGGARWWSRRLVQLYEDAGLVRFDK